MSPTKGQVYERYASFLLGIDVYKLVEALDEAANHILRMGCTCIWTASTGLRAWAASTRSRTLTSCDGCGVKRRWRRRDT